MSPQRPEQSMSDHRSVWLRRRNMDCVVCEAVTTDYRTMHKGVPFIFPSFKDSDDLCDLDVLFKIMLVAVANRRNQIN